MKATAGRSRILLSFLAAISSSVVLTGCQTSIGGQTLPSATYLDDDVQYFPAGPEFKLTNQVEATRKYQLEQEQLRGGDEF
ncbi:MAG: hypothetical protein GY758_05515 [Fuerstiella sp.]|nr:hypothetical protein [Fuerstiella sp.]MCP4507636.1 hypothetical protein [Fuerstiella sp.]MDG2130829.1 hypothetical protein [Fuerstiella sp.]